MTEVDKGRGKVHTRTGHKGPEGEQRFSLFHLGTRWGWVANATRSSSFTPQNTQYPFYKKLRGPQDRSGRVRKISLPPGFHLRTV
jgi:hypothetical protein